MLRYILLLGKNLFLMIFLKRNPQDLPASDTLFAILVLIYFFIGGLYSSLQGTFYHGLLMVGLSVLFMSIFVYLCLKSFGCVTRWTQTVTALTGSEIILTLFSLPILPKLINAQESNFYSLQIFLLFFLFVWGISVQGHIFRHAFTVTFSRGLFAALIYNILLFMLASNIS